MSYEKTIVCLANSRKESGRCVAGLEINAGRIAEWIRPVSNRPKGELSEEERQYENGGDPEVLDIITIRLARPEPADYQTENHVIDPDRCWTRSGVLSWSDLHAAVEDPRAPLWHNGDSSSYGENDRVPVQTAAQLNRSLYLIRPSGLRLVVGPEGGGLFPARRRVRAKFQLGGHHYSLVVTDPPVESNYRAKPNGEYPITEALLCVSLGELFQGHAYKLAAGVITPDRAGSA